MTSVLKTLLSNDNPLFSHDIAKLERSSGDRGIDARLISDISVKATSIVKSLGLDPHDTTGAELYAALNATMDQGRSNVLLGDADCVLVDLGDGPISFNPDDVLENSNYGVPYKRRSVSHGQNKLKNEIVRRYLNVDRANNDMVYHLAQEMGLISENGDIIVDKDNASDSNELLRNDKVLVVGDIISGLYVYVDHNKARVDIDTDGGARLSFPYGLETPYKQGTTLHCIGSGANSAIAMSRMGINVGIMSFVGDDIPGKSALNYLPKENVETTLIGVQKGIKSHQHYIVCYDADHITFSGYEDYTYKWTSPNYIPDYIYLTDISENSWQLHLDLIDYLDKNPSVKLAFRPGVFHINCGIERMKKIYEKTDILCLNRDNASLLVSSGRDTILSLMKKIYAFGPKIIVITDGVNGSYAFDGTRLIKIPNYPNQDKPYDRTGAGDCFASTFIASLIYGETIESAAKLASINSMSVTQKMGPQAGLLSYRKIKELLNSAPEWYHGRIVGE
jgi:sugar/nucleoside kinase (ribokinase family)